MSDFMKQMHEREQRNKARQDGWNYGKLYAKDSNYGGVPLDKQLEALAKFASDEYDNPDDKLFWEAYQEGFKDALEVYTPKR